jgi:hypothetical protein
MAETKQDKATTLQASEAEPAPSAVTPEPSDELTEEALEGVAGGKGMVIVRGVGRAEISLMGISAQKPPGHGLIVIPVGRSRKK